jgi:hypothetical protein
LPKLPQGEKRNKGWLEPKQGGAVYTLEANFWLGVATASISSSVNAKGKIWDHSLQGQRGVDLQDMVVYLKMGSRVHKFDLFLENDEHRPFDR